MKKFKVFKRRWAFECSEKYGINWIGTEPNYNNPKFKVFLFEDTEDFRRVFDKLNNK
jgi:hypothetical protein